MRYLVTGAQGFTGRFVCAAILQSDRAATVVGTGRSAHTSTSFTHAISWQRRRIAAPLPCEVRELDDVRYRYAACDLSDGTAVAALIAQSAPDVVIHLAAALRDDAAHVLVASNVGGTMTLVSALARSARRPLLILGSSGSVYGIPAALPLTEDTHCAPFEPYAMSKFAAELVARVVAEPAGLPTIVARIFNIAGPGQDERHVCGRFAAQAAAIMRGDAPPTLEIGDLRPTRDFIDVRDVAQALVQLARHGTPGEIYNVAAGTEVAIGEVLGLTLRAAGLDGHVTLVERYVRAGDFSRAFANIGKLRACGYAPAYKLERTIADILAYYVDDVSAAADSPTISATS